MYIHRRQLRVSLSLTASDAKILLSQLRGSFCFYFTMNNFIISLPDQINHKYHDSLMLSILAYALFNGHVRKNEFITKLVSMWWGRKNASNLWKKGTFVPKSEEENPYLSIVHSDFISIRSHRIWSKIHVTINEDIMSRINSKSDLSHLIMWLEAGRPRFTLKITDKVNSANFLEKYLRTFKSITLAGLAHKFNISGKQSMCQIMKVVMEKFGGTKTARYTVHNEKLARLANVYTTGMKYRANKRSHILKNVTSLTRTPGLSVSDKRGNAVSENQKQDEGVKLYDKVRSFGKPWFKAKALNVNLEWFTEEDYSNHYHDLYNLEDADVKNKEKIKDISLCDFQERAFRENSPELFTSIAW